MTQRYSDSLFAFVVITFIVLAVRVADAHPQQRSTAQRLTPREVLADSIPQWTSKSITLDVRDVPLEKALKLIAEHYSLRLWYSEAVVPIQKTVTLSLKEAAFSHTMKSVLSGTNLAYKISERGQLLLMQTTTHQATHTLSGFVRDAKTGEELIGAILLIKEMPGTGTTTNAYGFYSLTIPEGEYTASAQFLGYETKAVHIQLRQNIKLDFQLNEKAIELTEVLITGERKDENITKTQMGVEKLSVQEIRTIPVLMGEKDILKTIQLLPGVKSAGEGNSGFYVRGGGVDENLILLDEATVYNAAHLLGFFSVFNSDAIKDVTIFKGGMPSEYGGRLSSVLDIKMKDGHNKEFGLSGGIGLISSHLNIEGPIVKERGSFTVSGRRTYADLFLKLSSDSSINQSKLYFYDLNAKANYRINEDNRIFLSGYFGRDVLGFGDTFGIDWGNSTATLRWNHLLNEKMFSNTSLIYSDYDYTIRGNFAGNKMKVISRIENYNIKQDFNYYADAANEIKFGLNAVYHTIVPGIVTLDNSSQVSELRLTNRYAWENALYASHAWKATKRLSVEYGARLTSFSILGPGDFYTYNASGEPLDTISYGSGDFVKTYFNIEPRVAANFILDEQSSIKASYARNTQHLHLLSSSTADNPMDRWIPSSNNIKPQIADQVSLGYFRNFMDNTFECSVEAYSKHLQNQIDYKDGAQLRFNEDVESELLFGKGRAYGIELFLKKKSGRFTGWISYTLSRVERKFDGINNGNYYPARQDRTHDISLVGVYQMSERWSLSATWVYYTGNAVTFPSGKYESAGQIFNYYTERNGYRMPAYHRLDIGASWQGERSGWTFSLYNAYGRENAYSITFRESESDPTRTEALRTSLFKFVPSVTYNFKF